MRLVGVLLGGCRRPQPRCSRAQCCRASLNSRPPRASRGDTVDYNWDVRPILSENCFQCHGPDEKSRRASLRLDQREGATTGPERRHLRRAIIPGDPDNSELIKRVTHLNVAARMPPSITNKTLTAEKIDVLRRWIVAGARDKPHWSFISPQKPAVPKSRSRAAR